MTLAAYPRRWPPQKTPWRNSVAAAARRRIRRSISRVLFGRRTAVDGHSSGTVVTDRLARPTRTTDAKTRSHAWPRPPCRPSLHGLAPGGVYRAGLVTAPAVRSYRTLSPLPAARPRPWRGRFAFCGTFPGVAPAGRYPAPCFRGARTFLQRQNASGHPTI